MHYTVAVLPLLASLLPLCGANSAQEGGEIQITSANSTTRWEECSVYKCGKSRTLQYIEVALKNTADEGWIASRDSLSVEIDSSDLKTVHPARIKRLMPDGSAIVEVGVINREGTPLGAVRKATAKATWATRWHRKKQATLSFDATCGIPAYDASATSVNTHQSPNWFRHAKYGIFIHWGVYSVPAYGSTGENEGYSEWYWNSQRYPGGTTQTWEYHRDTYGEDVVYDDFIANFTVDKFDPKEWVDLIADAGAKYFVPTTKHHDGFSLFDMPSSVSDRNSVKQYPHRDLIKELFDAAEKHQPQLVRGTYFSMPEWYNPAYTKYGDGVTWGAGPPVNAYTNETVPYTGYTEVDDFVSDIQSPQMEILFDNYKTSIMWCDIGRASQADQLLSKWLNAATSEKRQVTFNSRCGSTNTGSVVGDYETPEYKPVNEFSAQHWEGCRGMDPHSFGYNKLTPDDEYMNASAIVQTVVDITAKNGNLLLDIGPRADGSIPDIMAQGLRQAGSWFKAHAESIYNTKYWPEAQGQDNLRYTTTDDAFYIHVLSLTAGDLTIPDKVPFMKGDKVVILGGKRNGHRVTSKQSSDGHLVLSITDEIVAADQYTWTFKIKF